MYGGFDWNILVESKKEEFWLKKYDVIINVLKGINIFMSVVLFFLWYVLNGLILAIGIKFQDYLIGALAIVMAIILTSIYSIKLNRIFIEYKKQKQFKYQRQRISLIP